MKELWVCDERNISFVEKFAKEESQWMMSLTKWSHKEGEIDKFAWIDSYLATNEATSYLENNWINNHHPSQSTGREQTGSINR